MKILLSLNFSQLHEYCLAQKVIIIFEQLWNWILYTYNSIFLHILHHQCQNVHDQRFNKLSQFLVNFIKDTVVYMRLPPEHCKNKCLKTYCCRFQNLSYLGGGNQNVFLRCNFVFPRTIDVHEIFTLKYYKEDYLKVNFKLLF